jgi:P-type E1-E2 ATPase
MMKDAKLYSTVRDRPANVSASSLNEELGMIKHVFTDKTGTLTCNKMEFRFCVVGERCYGKNEGSHVRRATFTNRDLLFTFDTKPILTAAFTTAADYPQPLVITSTDNATRVEIRS